MAEHVRLNSSPLRCHSGGCCCSRQSRYVREGGLHRYQTKLSQQVKRDQFSSSVRSQETWQSEPERSACAPRSAARCGRNLRRFSGDIRALILSDGMRLTAFGILIGLAEPPSPPDVDVRLAMSGSDSHSPQQR
jgi:hypothetical protein